jgi:hypothetical protein
MQIGLELVRLSPAFPWRTIKMTGFKTKVAEAMGPMLDVFHSIGEAPLHRVAYFHVHGCLERIVLSFGPTSLVVVADEDDDTVAISAADTDALEITPESDVSHLPLWEPFIAKPFGWGYAVVNQQGYCDGLLLSFGDIRPKVLLQIMASSIEVTAISEVSPPSQSR